MAEKIVDINGVRICYQVHGDGYPLVLLHGFGMYKEFWKWHAKELSKDFKIITLDIRGCGNSGHPIEPYFMELLADDIRLLLDYLNIEITHLGGHSFGGMIAQHFALNYPNRLNKSILMSTFANLPLSKSGLEMYKRSQLSFYEAKVKDPSKAFWDKMKQRFSRNFFKEMNQNPGKLFHNMFSANDLMKLEETKGTSKPQDILNQINAITHHNTVSRLNEIKNETLILAAEKDRIVPKIASELIDEKIPNSKLIVFKSSHFFMLEEAPHFNLEVLNFLRQ
ncbi:MAG: alpha/beta hydrolase [Candidatus Lokiarchaeota archaeon]|nr:alpha/beta hydrolase [Candidatus Lokiarchaeota archaeon]